MWKFHNKILSVSDNVLTISAEGVGFGELAKIYSSKGISLGQVIRIQGSNVFLQLFEGGRGVSTQDSVRFLGRSMQVSSSYNLLGRVFNGSGEPLDSGPRIEENKIDSFGITVNPVKRIIPNRMVHTGIPMIDVFNTLVVSQKLPIFTAAGEPYHELMARIALQARVDYIILGGMGLHHDHFLFFKDTLEKNGVLSKTVFFIHTSADSVAECLLIPDNCLAVAEQYALMGNDVLVLLTDMTNFCDALKEVSISMDQIPSNRGYPGELYSQLARRYERAVDFENGGSVTILTANTMPGGDITHPVPDNTGYITEGQFYLHEGKIDPFGSLSRLKQLVNKDTREDHRALMDGMIQLFATFRETQEKRAMGFRLNTWDQKMMRYGNLFETKMMDLNLNISLTKSLDLGWSILSQCFEQEEIGLPSQLIKKFWPKSTIKLDSSVIEDKKIWKSDSTNRLPSFALNRPEIDTDIPS